MTRNQAPVRGGLGQVARELARASLSDVIQHICNVTNEIDLTRKLLGVRIEA